MPGLFDKVADSHAAMMEQAANKRGVLTEYVLLPFSNFYNEPVRWLSFSIGEQGYLYCNSMLLLAERNRWGQIGRHVNGAANLLIRDKHKAKSFLRAHGFRTPQGQVFRRTDLDQAMAAYDDFAGPVCVKPNQRGEGVLVTPLIRDRHDYEEAVRRVAAESQKILVEESVSGQLIRFFFVRPKVVAAKLSRPASVLGDGVSSIQSLVDAKNEWRRQRAVPGHKQIAVDRDVVRYLRLQGRRLDDVPARGERVFLRGTSNGATGADSIAAPDLVHPSYVAVIEAACNAIETLNITTVDVMIEDPKIPENGRNYWILEINRNAGVVPYVTPWKGESQDVCGAVLDFLERRETLTG